MGLTQNLYCFNLPDILWDSISTTTVLLSLILRFIKFTVIANRVHIANTAWHCMTLLDTAWHYMTLHDTACLAWHLQDTHGEHFMTLHDIYFVGLILTAAVLKQISWNGITPLSNWKFAGNITSLRCTMDSSVCRPWKSQFSAASS